MKDAYRIADFPFPPPNFHLAGFILVRHDG
jgi:hypothetical protein